MKTTPGAVPRGCYTCYRGNLAADPQQKSSGDEQPELRDRTHRRQHRGARGAH